MNNFSNQIEYTIWTQAWYTFGIGFSNILSILIITQCHLDNHNYNNLFLIALIVQNFIFYRITGSPRPTSIIDLGIMAVSCAAG